MIPADSPRPAVTAEIRGPAKSRNALKAALLLWILPMVVIAALVIHAPMSHTVTNGSYHPCAKAWWEGKSLYVGPSGMNYLPHFAILFTPFDLLPYTASEIVWRWCAALALASGLWQLTRELFPEETDRAFLWATILTVPLSLGALRNGNANAIFGGVTLLAIVAIMRKRWWVAAGWMALAVGLKPIGIVLFLLAGIYYVPLMWRLALAFAGLVVFPFLFASPAYVQSQFIDAAHNLQQCSAVSEHRFADLNGILRTFGTELPPGASTIVRVVSGALTAVLWLWGAWRLRAPWRELWLYALAAAYLMVFNPMTEANSYVIVAPAFAAWTVGLLFRTDAPRRALGWVIGAMVLSMAILPNPLRPLFHNSFALFWHPAITILFVAVLAWYVARPQPAPAA